MATKKKKAPPKPSGFVGPLRECRQGDYVEVTVRCWVAFSLGSDSVAVRFEKLGPPRILPGDATATVVEAYRPRSAVDGVEVDPLKRGNE